MRPQLFKLGLALALSLACYLRLRLRPRQPPPPYPPGPSTGGQPSAAASGLKDELRILTSVEALGKIINGTSPATTTTTVTGLSPSGTSSGDEEGFLLPEFNQLVLKEFEASQQDPETMPTTPTSSELEMEEKLVMEQEIAYLRNLVDSLRERERTLEIQLLGYHGLREQEAAVKEFENRLNITVTEAKLYSLKMESLRAENQRLQAQESDYSRAVAELKSARVEFRLLERMLRSDAEQAKGKITALQQRVAMLKDREHEEGGDTLEVEDMFQRLKELEGEAMELRKVNSRLAQENSELKLKLRSAQMPTSSVLKGLEAETLEEANCLREENDRLKKDIEQLHTDRYADVEELVYLRWINACLRYELRNYQPHPGKTVARDLSKSLSPKSEQKAKQLIVEYANFGINERNMSLIDFDSENCSSSQASNEEPDDSLIDISSTTKSSSSRKSKFISKLKKLVLDKASSLDRTPTGCGNSERRGSFSPCSFGRGSNDSFSSCISVELASFNQSTGIGAHINEQWQNKGAWPQSFSRSFDILRPRRDMGTSYSYQSSLYGDDSLTDLSPNSSLDHRHICS